MLQLIDPDHYNLDTALSVLATEQGLVAFALRKAFSPDSWLKLNRLESLIRVEPVSRAEAVRFALNWVEVRRRIFVAARAPRRPT